MGSTALREHSSLPAGPDAGSRARAVVRRLCATAELGADVAEVAVLLTHELVSNAVEHGAGRPELELVVGDRSLRIAVTDADDRRPAPVPLSDELTERGRGLLLVSSLAGDWGVDTRADGKTVWCEIALAESVEAADSSDVA